MARGADNSATERETLELVDGRGITIDQVTYADEGDWSLRGRGPVDVGTRGWVWLDQHDGGGKSLELINAAIANQYGQNWAASVTDQGTPGTANSVKSNDVAPLVLDVSHSPAIPNSADDVTVTARLLDEADGASASVAWRVGSTNFATAPMRDDGLGGDPIAGDGRWTATIPKQPNNTVVEFYVQASDVSGNTRTWPAPTLDEGQATNLLYQVDDQFDLTAEWQPGSAPVYHQIMTVAERSEFENINRLSDAEMNATFIVATGTGIEVRYNAGVRIRGSGSRNDNPPSNRINIPSDRPLQGVSALNLNERGIQDQIAGSVLFRLAGLPAAEAKAVLMKSNGVNLRGDQLYAHVEPLNQGFVSNQFPLDDRGNLYKGRRPDESPPGGLGAGLVYFGEDPAPYVSYDKLTNASEADWADVIRLTDALNNSPDADYVSAIERVLDVDQWLRFFAMNTLLNNREYGLVTGDPLGDDYAMYRGAADARFKMVPHDLDSLFEDGNGAERSIFAATQVPALGRMLTHPLILPRYYAQLNDLIDNVLTTERAELALTEALRNVSTPAQIQEITDFLQARADYVLRVIPHSQLTVTSGLPVVGEFHRSASAEVALSGSISAETQSVFVNGQQAAITGLDRTWSIGEGTGGQAQTLVPRGAAWDYLDDGSDLGTSWRDSDFVPDASWKQGAAELGYGDGDERTTIGFGSNPNNKHITTYFRHEFEILDVSELVALKLSLLRDDGAAVFLNGIEVARDNLPADADFATQATGTVGGGEESTFFEFSVDPSHLVIGKNVLAVEVHQANPTSSDISFNLELEALLRGDVRGLTLHPGINRFFVEAYERADAEGTPRESQTIDIWYDDGTVQNVSGALPAGDTRWTAAEGPYRVSGTLVVPGSAKLTIEPGTSVYFEADAGLAVSGTLVAAGTEYDRIRFTSIPNAPLVPDDSSAGLPNGPPHWDGVQFIDSMSPDNLISYADIEYAQDVNGSIGVVNSEAVIDHVTFRGTHLRMVHTEQRVGHRTELDVPEHVRRGRGGRRPGPGQCFRTYQGNRYDPGRTDIISFGTTSSGPTKATTTSSTSTAAVAPILSCKSWTTSFWDPATKRLTWEATLTLPEIISRTSSRTTTLRTAATPTRFPPATREPAQPSWSLETSSGTSIMPST